MQQHVTLSHAGGGSVPQTITAIVVPGPIKVVIWSIGAAVSAASL